MKKTVQKATKMVEEITQKRKMTQAVKDKLDKKILWNMWLSIIIMLYFCIADGVYIAVPEAISSMVLKGFAIAFILVTICVFEMAYRRENGALGIVGIELLVFSIIMLYMPQIFKNLNKGVAQIFALTPFFCAMYYIIKSMIDYVRTEENYQNNLSDVKEIVREEE